MRTTLNIDDDVFASARSLSRQNGLSLGQTVSELLRRALSSRGGKKKRNGVPLFEPTPGAGKVTDELVKELRDAELAP